MSPSIQFVCLLNACCLLLAGTVNAVDPAANAAEQVTETPASKQGAVPSRGEFLLQKEAQVRQKLQALTEFDFQKTPLSKALEFLGEKHDLDIVLDQIALKEEGVPPDYEITLKLKEVTLAAALGYLLEPIDLDYVIKEEALLVTTLYVAEQEQILRIYPVTDLVQYKGADGALQNDEDSLPRLITGTIAPNSWDAVGGPGGIKVREGLLIVSQTSDTIAEIELVLAAIRKVPVWSTPVEEKSLVVVSLTEIDPQTLKIKALLEKQVPLDFEQTPLNKIVAYLEKELGCSILVDAEGLKYAGVKADVSVTMKSKHLALRSSLDLVLSPLELEMFIHDGVLNITSRVDCELELETVIYDVRDLLVLPRDPEQEDIENALASVAELLEELVHPNSWDSVGGPSSVLPFPQRGALVVASTEDVHIEIERLLARLRKAKQAQAATTEGPRPDLDALELIVYRLQYPDPPVNEKTGLPESPPPTHLDTRELVELIPELLGAEVWGAKKGATIHALPDRLIVNQSQRVHRKIKTLLHQLDVQLEQRQPGVEPGRVNQPSSTGGGIFNIE